MSAHLFFEIEGRSPFLSRTVATFRRGQKSDVSENEGSCIPPLIVDLEGLSVPSFG